MESNRDPESIGPPVAHWQELWSQWGPLAVYTSLAMGVLYAIHRGLPVLLVVAGVLVFVGAVWCFLRFMVAVQQEGPPVLERHWGGLGGGLGGISLSSSLTYLLMALTLATAGFWIGRHCAELEAELRGTASPGPAAAETGSGEGGGESGRGSGGGR